jgi:hypothetical protein
MVDRLINISYLLLAIMTLWYLSSVTERLISSCNNDRVQILSFKDLCSEVGGNYGEAGNTFYCKVSEK